jgi:hypothetical protein
MPQPTLRARRAPFLATIGAAILCALAPASAGAQDSQQWNAPEAVALVARARVARQADAIDPERRAYQAMATGHVFFLVDRPSTGERTLVKADQIAIEVYWKAPRSTRQRIVGMRDQKVLPTNIRYHLDHLTVVQDDFADLIRIGDGDEVSSVVHPVAPGAEQVYDFALGDAIAIAFPDGGQVEVQEIRVRPRALDRPGFVGSVFVDRASAAIVRMKFTFTPASYVDSYLDYIQIALDNSLWEGKWWLPYRQEVEVRREMPQLDFMVGSVIRGRFDVGEYVLNPELPEALFSGNRVTAVSEAEREAYEFSEPLIPPVDAEGLAPTPTLEDVRAEALQLTAGRYLSGLSRFRPYLPTASHLARWNRAEGTFVGAGAVWRPNGGTTLKAHGGWAFGPDQPELSLTLEDGEGRAGIQATWRELRDLGPFPGATGAVNTLSALIAGEDWLDPWFSSGVEVFLGSRSGSVPSRFTLIAEHHDNATIVLDSAEAADFRRLPDVTDGWLLALEAHREPRLPGAFDLGLTARLGTFDPAGRGGRDPFGSLLVSLGWERGPGKRLVRRLARLDYGAVIGDFPQQARFFLGGPGTLPGHPYREQVGDVFFLVRLEASRPIWGPWVAARGFSAAGATGDLRRATDEMGLPPPFSRDGIRASAGAGVGLFWDVLHLDLARGLDGGEWELVVSVDRRFWGWL